MVQITNKRQKLRFAAIGAINTAIDFAIFLGLSTAGMPIIAANFVATSTALGFSFFANKKYTFSAHGGNVKRQVGLFLAVTLFGLWVLQPIVLLAARPLLTGLQLPDIAVLFVGKLAATVVTLIWNYMLYSRVVFKPNPEST